MLTMAMYVVKEQFGRYETVDTLADGAMGSVVLARDRLMDRLVAVKTVKLQEVPDPGERQRLREALLSEAQVIQLLSHPNIVSVHDIVNEPGNESPSLVMEYVQGSTLEAYLKGGQPLPLDFALAIATQVSRALEHAHTMGVIHGDIKPSNILISDDGEHAKIVDFGIARLMTHGAGRDERLFGTPRYISPEQILGQKADQRSDLFSLGIVLYEMLTGHSPFEGKTSEEITQEIASGAADLTGKALREVPETLHSVLRRALERDPNERFQSARQFAETLQDPSQIRSAPETVTTQDLSALVVPEFPEFEEAEVAPGPIPAPAFESKEKEPQAPGHYSTGQESIPWRRLAGIAALTAIPTLLVGLLVIWLATPSSPPDGRFSEKHLIEAQVLPLFKEGQRQMLEGQPDVAVRLFRRAQDMVPASSEVAQTLRQAEADAVDHSANQKESQEIEALLSDSRDALDLGNSQRALSLATQALSMDPENPAAQALIDAAGALRSARAAKPRPTQNAPPPVPADNGESRVVQTAPRRAAQTQSAAVRPSPLPKATPRDQSTQTPVSGSADLRVDVFSYLSKGVLTVYADQDQVLLKPFRFVQKAGFMRKKKTAGRLETSVVLPAGPTEFRIYVSADGQETQTVNLAADLEGGRTHVLRLIIAENGSASAQLN